MQYFAISLASIVIRSARVVLNLWLQMMTMQIVLVVVAHKCTGDQCVRVCYAYLVCGSQTRMHCKTSITYRIAPQSVLLITWKLIFLSLQCIQRSTHIEQWNGVIPLRNLEYFHLYYSTAFIVCLLSCFVANTINSHRWLRRKLIQDQLLKFHILFIPHYELDGPINFPNEIDLSFAVFHFGLGFFSIQHNAFKRYLYGRGITNQHLDLFLRFNPSNTLNLARSHWKALLN